MRQLGVEVATAPISPGSLHEWFPAVCLAAAPITTTPAAVPDFSRVRCISEAQFHDLQSKHGRLYQINVTIDDTESYTFFAKRPTRSLLSMIASYASKQDYDKINDVTIANMIVAGDMTALEDGVVFSRVTEEITKLMKLGESFLSKV